jgi:polysaccharide biosynthesis transport protein
MKSLSHVGCLAAALIFLVFVLLVDVGVPQAATTQGKYTATAFLHVAMQQPVMFQNAASPFDQGRFEIFRETQRQLLQSRFVLTAALRKPQVARLSEIIQKSQRGEDPVDWLQRHLSVSFPEKAEIMAVSFRDDDPQTAATLVNAVVGCYMIEVVNSERDQKRARLVELERAGIAKEQEIRSKRQDLKNLGYETSADSRTISLKQKILVDEYHRYHEWFAEKAMSLGRLEEQLATQKAALANIETINADHPDVEAAVEKDPVAQALLKQLGLKKVEQIAAEHSAPAGDHKSSGPDRAKAERDQKEIKSLQDECDKRRQELAAVVRKRKRPLVEAEVRRIEASIPVVSRQKKALEKMIEPMREEISSFGRSTVEIEMLRADLQRSESFLAQLYEEREKAKVELSAPAQVTMPWGMAEVPLR